ncbi:MAG: Solitary outer membrane autotransporter beta-barrel domain [Verrucomicrobiota bacterium]
MRSIFLFSATLMLASVCRGIDLGLSNPFQDLIDSVRDFALEQVGPAQVGTGYAALINFASNPDIATATYYVDPGPNASAEINVYRVGFRKDFFEDGDRWRPFLQGVIPYQTIDYRLDIDSEEAVRADWTAYGFILSGGNEFVLNEFWTFAPTINLGFVRLESNAGYRGAIAENILDPAFEGSVFDWEADAILSGLTFAFKYEQPFDFYTARLSTSATYNEITTYRTSTDDIDISGSATTIDTDLEAVFPTFFEWNRFPVSVVLTTGGTAFLGGSRQALGFNSFLSYGAAVELNIKRLDWPMQNLRLGGQGIAGDNVTGWSIIFSYGF